MSWKTPVGKNLSNRKVTQLFGAMLNYMLYDCQLPRYGCLRNNFFSNI